MNADRKPRLPVFRDRLDILRGDLSYAKFADKLGLSRATVGFYLSGERVPDAITLKDIAIKCGVTADWLLGLTEAANVENLDISAKLRLNDQSIATLQELTRKPIAQAAMNAILESPDLLKSIINYLCAFLEDERKKSRFKDVPISRQLAPHFADASLVRLIELLPRWKDKTIEKIKSDTDYFDKLLLIYVSFLANKVLCKHEIMNFYGEDDFIPPEPEEIEEIEEVEEDHILTEEDYNEFMETRLEYIYILEEVMSYIDSQKKEGD